MVILNKDPKQTQKEKLNQHAILRTVHMCVRIIVHNCRKQYSEEHL